MKFDEMNGEQLQARLDELKAETAEEKRDALTTDELEERVKEMEAITAEIEARKAAAAEEVRKAEEAAQMMGKPIMKEDRKMNYNVSSPEYRSAFLKTLKGVELNTEEREAYVATTGDTTANNHGVGLLVPTEMLNRIWDLIDEQHAILGDITRYRTNTYLSIPVHTGIAQGDATAVSENAANDDEINNFLTVTLHGRDYSKTVKISYAMAKMSIDALETFLTNEIASRLGTAMARDTIAGILTDYYTTDNTVVALNSTLTYGDVAAAFGALKNANGGAVVYGTNKTIYTRLATLEDTEGHLIFQPDATAGIQGRLLGAPVKVEDGLSDDVLLIGYPKNVVGNVVQDIMVETDRDISKHVIIYSGYARYESKLIAPKSFAKISVTSATTAG
ncbi:MAG: phage major capsid protein [Lachnospiraceae bacterium]|nr:phage major capsid protein [Lachnospiraceae bacterium]